MEIKKVTDAAFRKYGKVVKNVDFTALVEELEKTPCTAEVVYEPSVPELEALPVYKELQDVTYGEMPIQIGFCNGNNYKLNALEYHRTSEIDVAASDLILLLGWQAGFSTSTAYGSARIKRVNPERIKAELSKRNIVVVTGFQGVNKYDDMTTLGRGGSDTSAVAIAASMHADLCQIYTDVDGVYTADPRKIPAARKLDVISYDEMLELATLGAQVLNNRSVEMAKKYHIELEVLSSLTRAKGTIVKEATNVEKMLISGVAKDENVARISVIGVPDKPGLAFRIFSKLAQKNVNVDIILQSIGRNGTKDISFTVEKDKMDATIELMQSYVETIGASSVVFDDDVAKVSIVGAGMESHPGVASDMFEALFEANVNIQMISTSEIKISVLIKKEDANKAVAAIHAKFFEQIGQ